MQRFIDKSESSKAHQRRKSASVWSAMKSKAVGKSSREFSFRSSRTDVSHFSDKSEGLSMDSFEKEGAQRASQRSATDDFVAKVKHEMHLTAKVDHSKLQDFTLNKLDWSDQSIIGRDVEIQTLYQAFDDLIKADTADTPCARLVSIMGVSGSGKSVLAQQLATKVQAKKSAMFCCGKFDLQQRAEPYTAISAAFSDLIEQVVASDDEHFVDTVRSRVQTALGADWTALRDVLPNIEKLIGARDEGKAIAEDPNMDARASRLRFFFQKFLQSVCAREKPVVMVLDDVQWADGPSLRLLEALLTDPSRPSLLVVTTCRSDDAQHIRNTYDKIQKTKQIGIQEIVLKQFDRDSVTILVSKVLRSDHDSVSSLSEIIYQKTAGNAFFVTQFLNSLVEDDILTFNLGTLRWQWDEAQIKSMVVTENVADLMTQKLRKLDTESQLILQVASCLGQKFKGETVSAVVDHLSREFVAFQSVRACAGDYLSKIAAAGLLDDHGSTYTFVHDQIQSAAFQLIEPDSRATLQLAIGKYFVVSHALVAEGSDQHELFLAVDLCNYGIDLLSSEEKVDLARYNLSAAEQAMKKSAFAAALKYAETGLRCLGDDRWSQHYPAAVDLSNIAIESSYCVGDFHSMEQHMDMLMRQDGPFEDKLRAYLTRILSFGSQERFADAVGTALTVLRELGVANVSTRPSILSVITELIKTKKVMKQHTKDTLTSLPPMSDRTLIMAMGVVDMCSTMAYILNPNVFLVLFLRSVRWSAKFGVNKYSPTAFGTYGVVIGGFFGDVELARMYGEAAIALSERLNTRDTLAKTISAVYGYVHHWTSDMRSSMKPLQYGYQLGMQTGEVEIAMLNVAQYDAFLYVISGMPLDKLVKEISAHIVEMREFKQDAIAVMASVCLQAMRKLAGLDDNPGRFSGTVYSEEFLRNHAQERNSVLLECFIDHYSMQLAYFFGDPILAGKYAESSKDFGTKVAAGHFNVPRHYFFRGLTAIELCTLGHNSRKNFRVARSIIKTFENWYNSGNFNILHMIQTLKAEIAALKKNKKAAAHLYEQAIHTAGRLGFTHDKALAHERAASYYLNHEHDKYWFAYHLDHAIQSYADWRCKAKVEQLFENYGSVLMVSKNVSENCKEMYEMYFETTVASLR